MSHLDQNRRAWDTFVRQQQRHTKPARDEDFCSPLGAINNDGWIGNISGLQVLCLAAGGGRQSALYAAAGAIVTVVDLSPEMLALDRQVATERQLNIHAVETSMDDLSMLGTAQFDLVVQPVSTCYVPDIAKVYREVARVMRSGGIYISQHKQPASLQADTRAAVQGYELIEPYYRSGPLPPVVGSQHREPGTLEFLHRWEELVGHLCRSGFVIEDLSEPLHAKEDAAVGTFAHRSQFVAPYVRIKARRIGGATETEPRSARLWTPET
ncbi:MAG: class I SAM-dependent methyltransferase [Planctomycetota bacterium]|nr:class I SAM-dependent methyltransferase [Planctomycetota bacterium]